MSDSILTSTKKVLGVAEDYVAFDTDLILYINGVFSTLNQLGIGPNDGFMIEDKEATWDTFIGDDIRFNSVKNYMCLRVRLLFDPPSTSFVLAAVQEQIKELEWRLNVQREENNWVAGSLGNLGTKLNLKAGLPFSRRIVVRSGMGLWASLNLFEARMQLRELADRNSCIIADLSSYLTKSYDGEDIVINWSMTGSQTRSLQSGYYDLILSDVGSTDANAIQALYGYLNVDSVVTSSTGG